MGVQELGERKGRKTEETQDSRECISGPGAGWWIFPHTIGCEAKMRLRLLILAETDTFPGLGNLSVFLYSSRYLGGGKWFERLVRWCSLPGEHGQKLEILDRIR